MNNTSNASSSGIGFTGLLTIVFIVLKLCKVITWSWWWVLSPLWISFGLLITVLLTICLTGLLVSIFTAIFGNGIKKKRRKKLNKKIFNNRNSTTLGTNKRFNNSLYSTIEKEMENNEFFDILGR